MSNMFGMMCARNHHFPDAKHTGIRQLKQLVLFASDNVSHCERASYQRLLFDPISIFFFASSDSRIIRTRKVRC